jgi:hypothetical protein
MRALLALAVTIATIAAVGCYHDKRGMNTVTREDYMLPPNEKRYSEPDTAGYRAPPPIKQQDTLMNKGGGGGRMGGNGLNGF